MGCFVFLCKRRGLKANKSKRIVLGGEKQIVHFLYIHHLRKKSKILLHTYKVLDHTVQIELSSLLKSFLSKF